MRNKLQYAYSIVVFAGVLVTAYMMMNREGSIRTPFASMSPTTLRSEATMVDPAVSSLFEMEDALSKLKKDKKEELIRVPTMQTHPYPPLPR